jgi:intracellular sulfur oxidation DsrE/DsrF family protein
LFNRPQAGDPILTIPPMPTFVDAGIESLQKMGTTFLLCNNALEAWTVMLADAGKGTLEEVGANLKANLLPGVVTVPAMVIAIEKAQKAGIAYNKQ